MNPPIVGQIPAPMGVEPAVVNLGIQAGCDDTAPEAIHGDAAGAAVGPIELALDGLAKAPAGTLLNERALASYLAVSPRTLRRMVQRGQLPNGIKLGGRRMWVTEKVMEFLVDQSNELAQEARRLAHRYKAAS